MRNNLKGMIITAVFLTGLSSTILAQADRLNDDPAMKTRVDEAFQPLPTNQMQKEQIAAGAGQALSQTFNQAGQVQNQMTQAKGTQEQAAAQVKESTEQSMQQGVSQTQNVANQLRASQSSVASDMQQAVNSTRVG